MARRPACGAALLPSAGGLANGTNVASRPSHFFCRRRFAAVCGVISGGAGGFVCRPISTFGRVGLRPGSKTGVSLSRGSTGFCCEEVGPARSTGRGASPAIAYFVYIAYSSIVIVPCRTYLLQTF